MLILGIPGECRCEELVNLKINDIEDVKSALLIKAHQTKTKKFRSFTVLGENGLRFVETMLLSSLQILQCRASVNRKILKTRKLERIHRILKAKNWNVCSDTSINNLIINAKYYYYTNRSGRGRSLLCPYS